MQSRFERLVDADNDLTGQKKSLDRRVPTRWNADFACLAAHVHFETPVKQLTSDSKNGLTAYALTNNQWETAKQLVEVLDV